MANNNRNPNVNRIRGPHSALTDFLASHNISAEQIRRDFEARQQAADAERLATQGGQEPNAGTPESPAQIKKRKRDEEKAIEKIKQSKGGKRLRRGRKDADKGKGEEETGLGPKWSTTSKMVAGQLENCAICSKRFTVTNYTKAGPNGGLLCPQCAKNIDKDEEKGKSKKKSTEKSLKRRQVRSNLLDGMVQRGAKSLTQLCVQKIADHIGDVEDFGELPTSVLNQLSLILSRRRVLNGHTIDFFLKPTYDSIALYDAANLKTDDFKKIFMICPGVKTLIMEHAGQFKDEVLEFITGNPAINIVNFRVGGLNLIHDEVWTKFFTVKGQTLETIKLSWMDNYFDEESFDHLVRHCPKLSRLKLKRMWNLGGKAIEAMADIKQLKHLTFERANQGISDIYSDSWVKFLQSRGKDLQTFAIDRFHFLDDALLDALHENCRHLSKLRISSNATYSDEAFVRLFTNWANTPLRYLNLSTCRDVDANIPVANPQGRGLCGDGFTALMEHSGSRLETLYVTSCRHISHAAFFSAFDGNKTYPHLQLIDVSFCDAVNDVILNGMFKSCPNLKEVIVFGCFKVNDPSVPKGVLVTGRVNVQDDVYYQRSDN